MWGKGIAKIMKRWYSRSHIVNKIADWIAKKIRTATMVTVRMYL